MKSLLSRTGSLVAASILVLPMISVFSPQIASALGPDPILIESCDDLNAISTDAESLAADYKLSIDIDCADTLTDNPNESEWVDGIVGGTLIDDPYTGVINNGYNGFEPIGGPMDVFTGTFDGNGKTISNLWIFRKETSNVGLFASTYGANIHDITLANSAIVGGSYTGGLVGSAVNTTVSNVTVSNGMTRAYLAFHGGGILGQMYQETDGDPSVLSQSAVVGGTVHGSGNIIGGLVGSLNDGVISGSTTSADVDGGYSVGGAVGEMYGGLVNLVTVGDVTVHSDYVENILSTGIAKNGDKTGGFVGYVNSGTISYSSTAATVDSEGGSAGGFVGYAWQDSADYPLLINNSYATGSVTGHGNVNENSTYGNSNSFSVGGFAGLLVGEALDVTNSYATGNVLVDYLPGSDPSYSIGGFVGQGGCKSTISDSYATGDVTALHSSEVGGFVGNDGCEGVGGTYTKVYATGNVAGDISVGGLVGSGNQTTITKSFASGNASGSNYVGGLVGYLSGASWGSGESASRVTESYALGGASASGNNAGGLYGFLSGGYTDNVYARGSATAAANVGGLVGEAANSWQITHAYATGALISTDTDTLGGFIGNDLTTGTGEDSPIHYSLYYDQQSTGVSVDNWATGRDTNQMKLLSNQVTFEVDPDPSEDINGFDFDTVWEYVSTQNNDYPLLIWQNDPTASILCEEAQMTSTTGRIYCELAYEGGDPSRATPAEWTITRYRISGDTEWTNMDWVNKSTGAATFYGLEPSTSYELSIRVNNNFIDQFAIVEGTTLSTDSDSEQDGASDSIENSSPNNGDVDNDGTLDSEQANVTSFDSFISNKYVALKSTCDSNFNVQIGRESADKIDVGYDYPAGLTGFVLRDCGANGSTATVTLYYFGDYDSSKFILRKSNSTTGQYMTVPGAVLSNVVIDGQQVLKAVYQIKDGGPLDQDGIADGNIVDPVGLALSTVGVPNTGL